MSSNIKSCEPETCVDRTDSKHESLNNAIRSVWDIRDRLQGLKSRINADPCNEPAESDVGGRSLKEVLTEGCVELHDVVSQCHILIEELNSELFD